MLQREDDADFWQSVTGTMEEGETPIQTAYRELAEETSLLLDPRDNQIIDCRQVNQYKIRESWLHRYPSGTFYNTEYVFKICVAETLPIVLTEHLDYKWLEKDEAANLAWSKSNEQAIRSVVPESA